MSHLWILAFFFSSTKASDLFDSSLFLKESLGQNTDFTTVVSNKEKRFSRNFRLPSDLAAQFVNSGLFVKPSERRSTSLQAPVVDPKEYASLESALRDCDTKRDCATAASLVTGVLRVLVGARTDYNPPVPYGSITAFDAQLRDYYRISKAVAPKTICEVGFNFGASLSVIPDPTPDEIHLN